MGSRAPGVLSRTAGQFLEATTLHGFKYFRDTNLLDRLFWLTVHCLNASCACALCLVLWERFVQNPSIIAVQSSPAPHAPRAPHAAHAGHAGHAAPAPEPYPVTTVCPPHRVSRASAADFVAKLSVPDGVQRNYLESIVPQLAVIFAPAQVYHRRPDLLMLDLVLANNNLTYRDALLQLAPECDRLLVRCSWRGERAPCGELFERVLGNNGVCCSFNRPPASSPSPSSSHQHLHPNPHPPRANTRALYLNSFGDLADELVAATASGLSVVINTTIMEMQIPAIDFAKFKMEDISLNSYKSEYMMLARGRVYWASAGLVVVQSGQADAGDVSLARCVPRDAAAERLADRCQAQCVSRVIHAKCGCAAPNYPRHAADSPCPPSRAVCLGAVDDDKEVLGCSCPAHCDEVRVNVELDSALLTALPHSVDPFYEGIDGSSVAVLRTHLAVRRARAYERVATVSWLTLISSLGGVFNMFLGVGIVSLLEVIFFVGVRLPLNARGAAAAAAAGEAARPARDAAGTAGGAVRRGARRGGGIGRRRRSSPRAEAE